MSDEQLQLPFDAWSTAKRDWEPSDAQASPVRPFDAPPPPPLGGQPAAIATSVFGMSCFDCGQRFIPVADGQRRCPTHQLMHDAVQSQCSKALHGPDPEAPHS